MTVRRALPSDKMSVLAMAKAFHAAAGLPFPFSAPHADAIFRASIENDDRLCLVLDLDGRICGTLAAEAGPHQFGSFKMASEIIWWIEPQYRGRHAITMVREFELWARQKGCHFAHLVGLGGEPVTGRLYQRQGYAPVERHFLKQL